MSSSFHCFTSVPSSDQLLILMHTQVASRQTSQPPLQTSLSQNYQRQIFRMCFFVFSAGCPIGARRRLVSIQVKFYEYLVGYGKYIHTHIRCNPMPTGIIWPPYDLNTHTHRNTINKSQSLEVIIQSVLNFSKFSNFPLCHSLCSCQLRHTQTLFGPATGAGLWLTLASSSSSSITHTHTP